MITPSELERLLALVVFNPRLTAVEGLEPFRRLLKQDQRDSVRAFLQQKWPELDGRERGGIAFVLAEHYLLAGDLDALQSLYAAGDEFVKQYTLNALWGAPGSHPQLAAGIVQLALDAAAHPAAAVRMEACFVVGNLCANGADVSNALVPLKTLLGDVMPSVRRQAAYAIGQFAKKKYDVSGCLDGLRQNLADGDRSVREANAWALWQASRAKQDIDAAVPDLVKALADEDDCDRARRNAIGALLHHARKHPCYADRVKQIVSTNHIDTNRKEIARFLTELADCK